MPKSPDTRTAAAGGTRSRATASAKAHVDRHRAAIRNFADEHGINIQQLAKRIGLKNANLFYNFLNDHSSALSLQTLLSICENFPGATLDQLVGRERREIGQVPTPATAGTMGSVADAEPAPPAGTTPTEPGPVVGAALEELARSLHTLRVATDIVERDLLRTASALRMSARLADPA